jgi:hypothetical protein
MHGRGFQPLELVLFGLLAASQLEMLGVEPAEARHAVPVCGVDHGGHADGREGYLGEFGKVFHYCGDAVVVCGWEGGCALVGV